LKNDIKTSSTDFLPPKPGADPTNTPVTDAASSAPADATAAKAAPTAAPAPKPANPLMPTSAHVIDLKNQSDQPKPAAKDSNEFMVKNNPFLQGADKADKTEPTKPVVKTVPLEVSGDGVKKPSDLPEPPKAEPVSPDKTDADTTKEQASKPDSTMPPTVDLAHQETAEANDPLKDAMVSEDDSKTKKPKKKLPTWLLVLIIVVAVVLIAVGTFAVLNIVARPTGV
jgi:hypothetical protein